MEFYLESGEKQFINKTLIRELEDKYNIHCMFGAVKSSYVYGIQNATSDRDSIIVYQSEHQREIFQELIEENAVDIIFMNFDYIINNQELYLSHVQDYPSCLYRKGKQKKVSSNAFRDDFCTEVIFECLASNCIWDSGYIRKNFNQLLQSISIKAVADYYFSRAYGNYKNNLQKDMVLNQKYMTTLIGICCIKWICKKYTIPNLNYKSLVEEYVPDEFIPFFLDILSEHKKNEKAIDNVMNYHYRAVNSERIEEAKSEKPKAYTKSNEAVNQWLYNQINEVKDIIIDLPENARFSLSFEEWISSKDLIQIREE